MSDPTVSVVIPTYNQPALLLRTLNSVFAQTFTDYEVVVVNDGSTDDTLKQLEPVASRLRVITQTNHGIGIARNRGIDEARGRFVAMLDHDDLWHPEKLARQVAFYEAHPECSIVSVPWSLSPEPEKCVFDVNKAADADGFVSHPMRKLADGVLFLITSTIMFDRKRAIGARYGTERLCFEDHPFQCALYPRGPVGLAGKDIMMVYEKHAENTSKRADYWFHGQRILRELRKSGELTASADEQGDLDRFLAGFGRTTVVQQLLAGKRSQAIRSYLAELPYQLRQGRAKFVMTVPPLLLTPTRVVRKVWNTTAV